MAVVVFDSDVLIGFLNPSDALHADAVAIVRNALAPGTRRLISAVNHSEIVIGPIRAGTEQRDHVVRLATFDTAVLEAQAELHPS
jgi:predicted nucleic acid-binding protein